MRLCVRVQARGMPPSKDNQVEKAAKKAFAMQPENLPAVRQDLMLLKVQRILHNWVTAAKDSKIER